MKIESIYLKFALIFSIVIGLAIGGKIEKGPSDLTVGLDEVAVFKCHVNKTDDEEVHWLIDGDVIFVEREIVPYAVSPADENRFSVIGPTEDDYDLQINRVAISDAKRYTCKIQPKGFGGNTTEKSAYLDVHRAPRRTDPDCTANNRPSLVDFEVGSEVVFACRSFHGNPDVVLTWINSEDDSVIDSILDNSSAVYLTRYFMQNLSIEDSGKIFTCQSLYESEVIGNQSGSCDIGPLNILYSPDSISIDSNDVAQNDKPLVLTCNARGGNPDSKTYEWSVYPEIPEERMYINLNTFSIRRINESDDGLVVTCSATNGIGGKLYTNRTIRVVDQPTTTPQTTTEDPKKSIFVKSIAFILIFILAGLIFLLGIVCTILYLLLVRKRRLRNKNVVEIVHPQDPRLTNRWIDAYETGSIKSFHSEPGYSIYERHGGCDVELKALKTGRYKSQDNVYKTPLILGESATSKMSPAFHRRRGFNYPLHLDGASSSADNASSHIYYTPGSPSYLVKDSPKSSSDSEPEYFPHYNYPSDHRGRLGYHDFDEPDGNRHLAKQLVRTGSERAPSRYRYQESPNLSRRMSGDSPVVRYKHRRQGSGGGALQQVLYPHSPLLTPPSSPARRKPRSAKQRQHEHARDDLQLELQKFDDVVKDLEADIDDRGQESTNIAKNPKEEVKDPRHRLWLYQQGVNGKYLTDKTNHQDNTDYDEDDVFVVLDDETQKATPKDGRYVDDEGYCSVHGYGTACGCETSGHGQERSSNL